MRKLLKTQERMKALYESTGLYLFFKGCKVVENLIYDKQLKCRHDVDIGLFLNSHTYRGVCGKCGCILEVINENQFIVDCGFEPVSFIL